MLKTRRAFLSSGLIGAVVLAAPLAVRAGAWPQRPVKFIVPFGPGAGADIGARVFAEKLQALWGQPVIVENRPGGDSIVAITAFLSAKRRPYVLVCAGGQFHRASVHVQQALLRSERHRSGRTRVQHHPRGWREDGRSLRDDQGIHRSGQASTGKYNCAMVQGITEFTFWGYEAAEGLKITQVPYRDINASAVDLGEGRIQIAMLSYAMLRSHVEAGRVRLIVVNNATRAPFAPDVPTVREAGYPSLEVEGLVGLFGITALANELKEKIAADVSAVSAAPVIAERLTATGQVVNYGGPKEFADAIAAQRAKIAATAKAIDFKPKQ